MKVDVRQMAVITLVALSVAMPSSAVAQEEPVAAEDGEVERLSEEEAMVKSEELFAEASKAYNTGEYEEALNGFLAAYDAYPAAVYLYNASLASKELGEIEQARKLARRAREERRYELPDALAKKNNRNIQIFSERLAEAEYERRLEDARGLDWRGKAGIGVGATGIVALGIGLGAFGQRAKRLNGELGEIRDKAEYDREREKVATSRNTAQVLFFSGLGLALAGGGMVAWDLLDVPERPTVMVGPKKQGMSVQLQWRF